MSEINTTPTMEVEIKNLAHICLATFTSLSYCHFVSSRIPKGKWRLISLLPIFYVYIIIPLYLTSALFIVIFTIFITWLGSFKLLLFAFDQGPLSPINSTLKSLPIFIATAALIFKVKPEKKFPSFQNYTKLFLNLAIEILTTALLVILYDYKKYTHYPCIVLAVYVLSLLFLLEDITFTLSSFVAHVFLGLEVDPPFDKPYLSTSVQEFWGRRWSLPFSSLLRQTVYRPVRSLINRDWALVVSFLVSGIMHELLFWYLLRARPSLEITALFVAQGVCVVVELRLKLILNEKRRQLPWFVSFPLTFGFLTGTISWLLIPLLVRNGGAARVTKELQFFGNLWRRKCV